MVRTSTACPLLSHTTILWLDDHPERTVTERRFLIRRRAWRRAPAAASTTGSCTAFPERCAPPTVKPDTGDMKPGPLATQSSLSRRRPGVDHIEVDQDSWQHHVPPEPGSIDPLVAPVVVQPAVRAYANGVIRSLASGSISLTLKTRSSALRSRVRAGSPGAVSQIGRNASR